MSHLHLELAIIILNYQTPKMVRDCLDSIAGSCDGSRSVGVVVVDNASPDGSSDEIERLIERRGWGSWVRLVRSETNGGFAAGNNVGLRAVEADRYLLLNSDTLVRPGAIVSLMDAMDQRPDVGIVGPRLEWQDGTPQESCFRYHTPLGELLSAARTGPLTRLFPDHVSAHPVSDGPMEPAWLSFACALIRREVLDQVGLLDAGYFLYFDDIDYCRRARRAGWNILHWPQARVVHLRGGSGPVKKLTASLDRRPGYFYASRARYFAKFYGRPGLWAANALWELGRAIAWGREVFGRKPRHTCRREALDIWINALSPLRSGPGRREGERA